MGRFVGHCWLFKVVCKLVLQTSYLLEPRAKWLNRTFTQTPQFQMFVKMRLLKPSYIIEISFIIENSWTSAAIIQLEPHSNRPGVGVPKAHRVVHVGNMALWILSWIALIDSGTIWTGLPLLLCQKTGQYSDWWVRLELYYKWACYLWRFFWFLIPYWDNLLHCWTEGDNNFALTQLLTFTGSKTNQMPWSGSGFYVGLKLP